MNNHSGSYALSASYNGVQACGPGPFQGGSDHLVHFFSGAWGELEWECVELVMRYMYLVYGIAPYSANGYQVVSNYGGSTLTKVTNNGTSVPTPGDILAFDISDNHKNVGHTAVVTAVSVDANGNGTVTYMQQNVANNNGWGSVVVTGKKLGDNISAWLHNPAGDTAPITLPDRSIVQGPNGALYVMAGGAKFYFGSMDELQADGYSSSTPNHVSQAWLDATPNIPVNKTVLRATNGSLAVMAGGTKFYFGSMDEYFGQGYQNGQWINVPQTPYDAIGSAPSTLPYDNTIIQQPDGTLAVMAGGVKFAFSTMSEYYGENYTDLQMVHVTQAPASALPTAPTSIPGDGNILVAPNGSVYVLAGGVKFVFSTMSDYYNLGYTDAQIRRVPQAPLSGIPDGSSAHPPHSATVLRAGNGQVYVVAGGVLFPESTMDELWQLGYGSNTIVALTDSQLALFGTAPTTVPPNETLLQGTDAAIWVMKSGQRRQFTSMTQFANMGYTTNQIVRVPDAVLNGIPSGGDLP